MKPDEHIISLPDDTPPFNTSDRHSHYWGYRVKVGLDEPYTEREVWVRNPRFSDNTQDAEVWYDDLWSDKGTKIDVDDGEDEGWIGDLHESIQTDLQDTWEPL